MTVQEHKSNARDALRDESSMPKRARLGKKIDHGKSVLTAGARQTRATSASTADQSPKQTESTAEPTTIRVRKTAYRRETVADDVKVICKEVEDAEDINKEVEVTPTSRSLSAKKVKIRVYGKIVTSIDDVDDYGQPDFETAVECEGTNDDDIDFVCKDNDHSEESEEEKEETRKLALPKKMKSTLLWIEMFCVRLH